MSLLHCLLQGLYIYCIIPFAVERGSVFLLKGRGFGVQGSVFEFKVEGCGLRMQRAGFRVEG